jgi:hypothetical protein
MLISYRPGFAAAYASWRLMQLALGLMGVAIFVAILLFLPETSHPGTRGIDKLAVKMVESGASSSRMLVFVNPFRPLTLMRSPNLMVVVSPLELLRCLHHLILYRLLQDFSCF